MVGAHLRVEVVLSLSEQTRLHSMIHDQHAGWLRFIQHAPGEDPNRFESRHFRLSELHGGAGFLSDPLRNAETPSRTRRVMITSLLPAASSLAASAAGLGFFPVAGTSWPLRSMATSALSVVVSTPMRTFRSSSRILRSILAGEIMTAPPGSVISGERQCSIIRRQFGCLEPSEWRVSTVTWRPLGASLRANRPGG